MYRKEQKVPNITDDPDKLTLPTSTVSSIIQYELKFPIINFQFALSSFKGEVTELVPVPAFKAAVAVREHGEVSSILMLSRHK
jgi:hypothetical protein